MDMTSLVKFGTQNFYTTRRSGVLQPSRIDCWTLHNTILTRLPD